MANSLFIDDHFARPRRRRPAPSPALPRAARGDPRRPSARRAPAVDPRARRARSASRARRPARLRAAHRRGLRRRAARLRNVRRRDARAGARPRRVAPSPRAPGRAAAVALRGRRDRERARPAGLEARDRRCRTTSATAARVRRLPARDVAPPAGRARGARRSGTLDYGSPEGSPELREALADYASRARAVRCAPDEVVSSTARSRRSTSRPACSSIPATRCVLEEPHYAGARRVFEAVGARLRAVPVDARGAPGAVACRARRAPPT